MKGIEGGILAAAGFATGACHCGIRANTAKDDLAMIVSQVPCTAAAVYTTNKVKAAPLKITRQHLADGTAQAIVVNSGNANACAPKGEENARRQAELTARKLNLKPEDIIVASTGVIGQDLPMDAIEAGISMICLDGESTKTARAIMTTDTKVKECAVEFEIDGVTCHMGGIAKGSGMIHPNMGTMLCFITTDAAIDQPLLQKMLLNQTKATFNRVSVDGDTSTNDMCVVLANGLSGANCIQPDTEAAAVFEAALHQIMEQLAISIAADGEGASRLLTVTVEGAKTESQAEILAMSVASSSLFKAAIFGADANWGRVLCALGYADADFDPELVDVSFQSEAGTIDVCAQGKGLPFDEDKAKEILSRDKVETLIDLHEGNEHVSCWGCDLTYEYVHINGDYRS